MFKIQNYFGFWILVIVIYLLFVILDFGFLELHFVIQGYYMKLYQLNYLYSSLVNLEVVEDFISKMKIAIEKKAGTIHQSSIPDKRKLGSPINKCQFAYLGTVEFDLEPNKINKLIEQLKSNQNLWRLMLLKRKRLFSRTLLLNNLFHQNREKNRESNREKNREVPQISPSQVNQTSSKEQVVSKTKKTEKKIENGFNEKHLPKKEVFIKSVPKIKKSPKVKISEIGKKLNEILD